MALTKCLFVFFAIQAVSAFHLRSDARETAGQLLLTPYIKAGKIQEARQLSLVKGLEENVTSYAGFLTVDEECDSNMFYWFFPSQNDWENDPVAIWLEGGPGGSGFLASLVEHGPIELKMDGTTALREYPWNKNASIIYIDNPVGVGYSYAASLDCYMTDEVQVGKALVKAMQQFYGLFPELQKNPFYIFGESYGGKYVPALGYAIHTDKDANINLKGLAIGNGWVDPPNQMHISDYLYQLGLVDSNLRDELDSEEENIKKLIENKEWVEANRRRSYYLTQLFGNTTGFVTLYNYLETEESVPPIDSYVTTPEMREVLHVGNATWNDWNNITVYFIIESDIMQSIRPWLEVLMDNYRVVLYSGQLDIIIPYRSSINFLEKTEWSGAEEYKTASRSNWYVGDELAGYTKTVGNFTEILMRNAGHMVALDQGKWSQDMFTRIVTNQPFDK